MAERRRDREFGHLLSTSFLPRIIIHMHMQRERESHAGRCVCANVCANGYRIAHATTASGTQNVSPRTASWSSSPLPEALPLL